MVAVMAQPWWPLSPWLSPGAAWFIFFNAVVAAIAVMSFCAQQEEQQQDGHVSSSRRRLCRSASSAFLDQLRSFSLFSVHPTTAGGVTVPMLDDLASDVSDSDYCHCSQEAEPAPAGEEESVMMAEHVAAASAPESNDEEEQDKSMSMDEAYAMVQQHRRPLQSPWTTSAALWPEKKKEKEKEKENDLAAKALKRRAHSGGRRKVEEAPEGKAELNARAELFIRQFREDLKLQRLNSLLRHTHAFGSLDGAPVTVR